MAAGCGGGASSTHAKLGSGSGSGGAGSLPGGAVTSRFGTEYENTGAGPMVAPTIPRTPSVPTDFGRLQCPGAKGAGADVRKPAPGGCTRTFALTASPFEQKISNFPAQRWKVWGYNHSTPGPTLISYAGEPVKLVVKNRLPVPTTVHPHGLHQPNVQDGVAGVNETPIMPGRSDAKLSGYEGAPVGMTRIFHYAGYKPVPKQYFTYHGQSSTKAP